MPNQYHYIITGAGCAGLSLLKRMMSEPFFNDKRILIIDQSQKNTNDRTWCFWEKETGIFESIVHHQWKKINFFSNSFSSALDIAPYQYKMIQGIDLYTHVKYESTNHPNIEWKYEKIESIQNTGDKVTVVLKSESLTADYVFNSILFNDLAVPPLGGREGESEVYLLLQHFKGWVIETQESCFDPSIATFMDFRIPQKQGTTFVYVMPITPNKALVEYTLFSETLLPIEEYEVALRDYIVNYLKVKNYTISHEEFGVIPMTNQSFPIQTGRIIYTGIAGGQAKGSSGYAFQFIQKRTRLIVDCLIKNKPLTLKLSLTDKKFQLYDSVLLNVLYHHKMGGDEIFAMIFKNNPASRILRFLDNESDLWEDLQIMRSVPTGIFLPAAIHEIRS